MNGWRCFKLSGSSVTFLQLILQSMILEWNKQLHAKFLTLYHISGICWEKIKIHILAVLFRKPYRRRMAFMVGKLSPLSLIQLMKCVKITWAHQVSTCLFKVLPFALLEFTATMCNTGRTSELTSNMVTSNCYTFHEILHDTFFQLCFELSLS